MHGGGGWTALLSPCGVPLCCEMLTQRANVAAMGVRPDPMEEGSVLPFPFHMCTNAESPLLPPHVRVRNTLFVLQIEGTMTRCLGLPPLAGCHQPRTCAGTEGQRF